MGIEQRELLMAVHDHIELASTDVVEIRHDLECVVAVSAGVAIGPVG